MANFIEYLINLFQPKKKDNLSPIDQLSNKITSGLKANSETNKIDIKGVRGSVANYLQNDERVNQLDSEDQAKVANMVVGMVATSFKGQTSIMKDNLLPQSMLNEIYETAIYAAQSTKKMSQKQAINAGKTMGKQIKPRQDYNANELDIEQITQRAKQACNKFWDKDKAKAALTALENELESEQATAQENQASVNQSHPEQATAQENQASVNQSHPGQTTAQKAFVAQDLMSPEQLQEFQNRQSAFTVRTNEFVTDNEKNSQEAAAVQARQDKKEFFANRAIEDFHELYVNSKITPSENQEKLHSELISKIDLSYLTTDQQARAAQILTGFVLQIPDEMDIKPAIYPVIENIIKEAALGQPNLQGTTKEQKIANRQLGEEMGKFLVKAYDKDNNISNLKTNFDYERLGLANSSPAHKDLYQKVMKSLDEKLSGGMEEVAMQRERAANLVVGMVLNMSNNQVKDYIEVGGAAGLISQVVREESAKPPKETGKAEQQKHTAQVSKEMSQALAKTWKNNHQNPDLEIFQQNLAEIRKPSWFTRAFSGIFSGSKNSQGQATEELQQTNKPPTPKVAVSLAGGPKPLSQMSPKALNENAQAKEAVKTKAQEAAQQEVQTTKYLVPDKYRKYASVPVPKKLEVARNSQEANPVPPPPVAPALPPAALAQAIEEGNRFNQEGAKPDNPSSLSGKPVPPPPLLSTRRTNQPQTPGM